MADFFLELYSEEIPARMQQRAVADLERLFVADLERLFKETWRYDSGSVKTFCTPRRMALSIRNLPDKQPELVKENKGPRVDAPQKALDGFMRAQGLGDLSAAQQRETPKGTFYFVVEKKPGRTTAELLPELILTVLAAFPWPRSMKWGRSAVRWVRPLRGIVALLDGQVLEGVFDPAGHAVAFGNRTHALRFPRAGQIAPDVIAVQGVDDYCAKMAQSGIILDTENRKHCIKAEADKLCTAAGLRLGDDEELLQEVAGLVECPVVMMGTIEPQFMDLPDEVLSTTMKAHQKYFSTVDASGTLGPRFVFVANLRPADGGQAVIAGNERVLSSRLSDARFFWDQDRSGSLESRRAALESVVFQKQLGTVAAKVGRMVELAGAIAAQISAPVDLARNVDLARRAAALCKADLTSGMVGEFPELQGIMGGYYARNDGEDPAVADAIATHYAPAGSSGACPSAPVAVAVALADRLDSLAGFFGTGQRPTGSKDPFALRRAALGVMRLVVDNKLRLDLRDLFAVAYGLYPVDSLTRDRGETVDDLMAFFADRWRERQKETLPEETPPIVMERDDNDRRPANRADGDPPPRVTMCASIPTIISAVRVDGDLVRVQARFDAVREFLGTEDGLSFLQNIYTRSVNIVRAAEKEDKTCYRDRAVRCDLLTEGAEKILYKTMQDVVQEADFKLNEENFTGALQTFIRLRPVMDDFFEQVMVNVDNPVVRMNRLALLARLDPITARVADFSVIGLHARVIIGDQLIISD